MGRDPDQSPEVRRLSLGLNSGLGRQVSTPAVLQMEDRPLAAQLCSG